MFAGTNHNPQLGLNPTTLGSPEEYLDLLAKCGVGAPAAISSSVVGADTSPQRMAGAAAAARQLLQQRSPRPDWLDSEDDDHDGGGNESSDDDGLWV